MGTLLTATVGTKGQVTLPRDVREFLGIRQAGELVGFTVDPESRNVRLTRLKVVSDEEDLTEAEYKKLLGLPRKKGGKTFSSMKSLLHNLKR